jgi:hypothetical protein
VQFKKFTWLGAVVVASALLAIGTPGATANATRVPVTTVTAPTATVTGTSTAAETITQTRTVSQNVTHYETVPVTYTYTSTYYFVPEDAGLISTTTVTEPFTETTYAPAVTVPEGTFWLTPTTTAVEPITVKSPVLRDPVTRTLSVKCGGKASATVTPVEIVPEVVTDTVTERYTMTTTSTDTVTVSPTVTSTYTLMTTVDQGIITTTAYDGTVTTTLTPTSYGGFVESSAPRETTTTHPHKIVPVAITPTEYVAVAKSCNSVLPDADGPTSNSSALLPDTGWDPLLPGLLGALLLFGGVGLLIVTRPRHATR